MAFIRRGKNAADFVVVVASFTPVPREGYRLGVPAGGGYVELLNSDAAEYGGSGVRNAALIVAEPVACHGQTQSITVTLPPLGVLFLARAPAVVAAR